MKYEDAAATTMTSRGGEDDHLDETSRTFHEPRVETTEMTNGDERHDVDENDDGGVRVGAAAPSTGGTSGEEGNDVDDPSIASSSHQQRLNRRIASMVDVACRKATSNSAVLLSRVDRVVDVAMLRYEELEIGKKLGNGSFSDV